LIYCRRHLGKISPENEGDTYRDREIQEIQTKKEREIQGERGREGGRPANKRRCLLLADETR